MSSWSKTLHGKGVTVDRAFLPLQHAMIRLGYELAEAREGKRLKFKKRTDSVLAWDNHRRAHRATLKFKAKNQGFFAKEKYLEVAITFDDNDIFVSNGAAKAWQEIADKLQVMLSDPAVFMPLAPPGPIMPPVSGFGGNFAKMPGKRNKSDNPAQAVMRERIVEREVLMVRCRYCAMVVRFEGKTCPNCGGPLEPA